VNGVVEVNILYLVSVDPQISTTSTYGSCPILSQTHARPIVQQSISELYHFRPQDFFYELQIFVSLHSCMRGVGSIDSSNLTTKLWKYYRKKIPGSVRSGSRPVGTREKYHVVVGDGHGFGSGALCRMRRQCLQQSTMDATSFCSVLLMMGCAPQSSEGCIRICNAKWRRISYFTQRSG
jgi:hypothetical protein